jgi:hypothetical protein
LTNLLKSKKGQAGNYIAAIILLLAFGITLFFNALMLVTVMDKFDTEGYLTAGIIKNTADKFVNVFMIMDYITVLLMVGLLIGVGITSYRIAAAPGFFIASIIMLPFLGFVSYFFNYLFIQIVSQSVFTTVYAFYPRTILICTNFHWILLAMFIIGSITLYGKNPQQGGADFQ